MEWVLWNILEVEENDQSLQGLMYYKCFVFFLGGLMLEQLLDYRNLKF